MAVALLFLYALLILWVGLTAARRTPDSFYVNNRESGAWGVGFSIFVSCVGASATIGVIGMAFAVGTPAFWWLGAGAAGLVLLSLALARKVRNSGAYTLPHMAETFLGPSTRPVISVIIVTAWLAILAAQFSALSRVLGTLTGLSPLPCLLIGLALICVHTLGGQSSIMRIDRIQALIILSSLIALLAWLTQRNPEWIGAARLEAVNTGFPPERLLYFLVIVGANYVVCPMLFGRVLSARNARNARLGGLIGAASIAICSVLIVAVGLACKGLIPDQTPQDEVLTAALGAAVPRWMFLAVSMALVSAIVSSADSCLVTAASVLSFDLIGQLRRGAAAPAMADREYRTDSASGFGHAGGLPIASPGKLLKASSENPWERGRLARIFLKNAGMMPALPAKNEVSGVCLKDGSRLTTEGTIYRDPAPLREQVCVMLLGLAGAALSLLGKSILGFLLMAYDIFACGVAAPVGIGLLLHGKRRINPRFAHAALAAGGILGLTAALTGNPLWSYTGIAASGILTLSGITAVKR